MDATAGYAGDLVDLGRLGRDDGPGIDVDRTTTHSLYYGRNSVMSDSARAQVGRLTDGQRDCLRLVYAHMTSKDIARALDISPHTVDMRLRTAMKTLGVASRIDAARALIDAEGGVDPHQSPYQSLIYQAPDVAVAAATAKLRVPASTTSEEYATQYSNARFSPAFDPSVGGPPRPAGASLPFGGDTPFAEGRQGERGLVVPLAVSLPWGSRNTLSPGTRLAWIAAIAIGSALGFGAVLGALQALKTLL